jgi:hypothetical protein
MDLFHTLPIWLLVGLGLLLWVIIGVLWLRKFSDRLLSNIGFIVYGEKPWIVIVVSLVMLLLWPIASYVMLAYAHIRDATRR